ncbi:MAG: DUF3887 domain-containing protein [Wujia sp.]
MTRDKFLKGLNHELRGIVKQERKKYISDYEELIADMMEGGMTEIEAVEKQGDYKAIAAEILNSVDDSKRVKRDVPGLIIHAVAILLSVLSFVCIVLFPGIATVGIVDGSGSSAVFFAGKMTEPIVLYIVTAVCILIDIVYAASRKKKGYVITAVVLLCLLAVTFLVRKPIRKVIFDGTATTETSEDSEMLVEDKTRMILDLFSDGNYERLCSDYTAEEMLPYMTEEYMEEAKSSICDDWGESVSYGRVYAETLTQNGTTYTVAQVSASYENVSVIFTITFDEDGKIAGFYMK